MFGVGSQALRASAHHNAQHEPTTDNGEMYARIPALLEQGMRRAEIAAMYGVTPGTLAVFCSQSGISLRKGGRRKRKLVLSDEPLPLSKHILKSLHEAARSLGKGSTERLVSDLLEKIVSDDLYNAVLDEEATPDRPVTPAPQSTPPRSPPSGLGDPGATCFTSRGAVNDEHMIKGALATAAPSWHAADSTAPRICAEPHELESGCAVANTLEGRRPTVPTQIHALQRPLASGLVTTAG
jgi:hypothetical protein